MLDSLNEIQIREKIKDFYDNKSQCGFEAFVASKISPKLRSVSLSESKNESGKTFGEILKEMFLEILNEQFLSQEVEYADGSQLADNQNKNLIIKQGDEFQPFAYLDDQNKVSEFAMEDLDNASGLMFRLRKGEQKIWLYQHLWSIMVPNKKKTNIMTRLMRFEDHVIFSEQRDSLLTISKKVDLLIIDNYIITRNISLLQKNFGFQNYIYQSAKQVIETIVQKNIVTNTEKLTEYISRRKSKYAKKMMRIGSSKVLGLTQEQLISKIHTLDRWKRKFEVNQDLKQITLNTYGDVENLIDLLDERYTRSDVTDMEYDTDVKQIAKPASDQ
jgi:hypothetical protein